ncbi:helicase RepA family protein [bacterium]|nr:helicase RepA family protein [bacterium]
MALDIALSLATGKDYHGFGASKGLVIMSAGEGHLGIPRRAEAWCKHNGSNLHAASFAITDRAALDNFEVGLIDEAILTIPLAEYFDPFAEMPTVHNNLRSAHTTMEQLDCVFLRLTDFARTVLKGEM